MRVLIFLLFPLLSFSQKVGKLDSTFVSEGLNISHVRYLNLVSIDSVYDSDTPTLIVHLGFNATIIEKFRLYGIDSPEIRPLATRKAGEESRQYFISLVEECDYLLIQTFPEREVYRDEKGKYGRYLGVLYGVKPDESGKRIIISINDRLVESGNAVYKSY